jgi:hypothetical protein
MSRNLSARDGMCCKPLNPSGTNLLLLNPPDDYRKFWGIRLIVGTVMSFNALGPNGLNYIVYQNTKSEEVSLDEMPKIYSPPTVPINFKSSTVPTENHGELRPVAGERDTLTSKR